MSRESIVDYGAHKPTADTTYCRLLRTWYSTRIKRQYFFEVRSRAKESLRRRMNKLNKRRANRKSNTRAFGYQVVECLESLFFFRNRKTALIHRKPVELRSSACSGYHRNWHLNMSNIHGLFSGKNDDDESDDENNRFVGGIGERGGGR